MAFGRKDTDAIFKILERLSALLESMHSASGDTGHFHGQERSLQGTRQRPERQPPCPLRSQDAQHHRLVIAERRDISGATDKACHEGDRPATRSSIFAAGRVRTFRPEHARSIHRCATARLLRRSESAEDSSSCFVKPCWLCRCISAKPTIRGRHSHRTMAMDSTSLTTLLLRSTRTFSCSRSARVASSGCRNSCPPRGQDHSKTPYVRHRNGFLDLQAKDPQHYQATSPTTFSNRPTGLRDCPKFSRSVSRIA